MASPINQQQQQRAIPVNSRKRFVLTDPIAFKFLEGDPSIQVIARREVLYGYECYLVEQWACSRTDPTFIITTFTADDKCKVVGSVLSIPEKEEIWSPRLTVYFECLRRYNAKPKETPLGTVMVTNLSSFPSSLTVIPIPHGDVQVNREAFFVNENLKRLGCAGRVGLTLSAPTAATTAKFYQLYRASDKIPLNMAVIELVKLCQVALVIFGELDPDYADGLLCDVTERAITDWWVEFGTEYYGIEPHDGSLGPTTVAALLGTLIGARNRLHAYGAPIAKDVFDVESTKRAIAAFQKGHKMSKTRRLDRQTLARIHRSTAKAASGDGWFVPRAVKSTMAELSGKGGEMVMDMVGAGNRAGIAEVETVDIEQFVQHVQGDRAKWLWRGKPRKETMSDPDEVISANPVAMFDDQSKEQSALQRATTIGSMAEVPPDPSRLAKKPTFEKHFPARPAEASRKLGRIKGAVGLTHGTKYPKDGYSKSESSNSESLTAPIYLDTAFQEGPLTLDRVATGDKSTLIPQPTTGNIHKDLMPPAEVSRNVTDLQADARGHFTKNESLNDQEAQTTSVLSNSCLGDSPSVSGSIYRGVDLHDLFDKNTHEYGVFGPGFKRTQSFSEANDIQRRPNVARWPKHLSFSLAADSVLTWARLDDDIGNQDYGQVLDISAAERSLRMRESLRTLEVEIAAWVDLELEKVEIVRTTLDQDQEQLVNSHQDRAEEYRELSGDSKQVMDYERAQLEESAKETEVLGAKLEYEINVLRGKVDDVEDGVAEFARQVDQVESRVRELEQAMVPKEKWLSWFLRAVKGNRMEDNVDQSSALNK